jgi:hypothetical protein
MKEFNKNLAVSNISEFPNLRNIRLLSKYRKKISEFLVERKDENEYFQLDCFSNSVNNDITKILISELENLGWKCKLSYGGTGLFIYVSETPSNCWEE